MVAVGEDSSPKWTLESIEIDQVVDVLMESNVSETLKQSSLRRNTSSVRKRNGVQSNNNVPMNGKMTSGATREALKAYASLIGQQPGKKAKHGNPSKSASINMQLMRVSTETNLELVLVN